MDFNSVIVTVECITIPPCAPPRPRETEAERPRDREGGRTRCPSLVALYVATVRASALSRVERAGSGPGRGRARRRRLSCVSSRTSRERSRPRAPDAARAPPRSLVSAVSAGTQRARVCAVSPRRETDHRAPSIELLIRQHSSLTHVGDTFESNSETCVGV